MARLTPRCRAKIELNKEITSCRSAGKVCACIEARCLIQPHECVDGVSQAAVGKACRRAMQGDGKREFLDACRWFEVSSERLWLHLLGLTNAEEVCTYSYCSAYHIR